MFQLKTLPEIMAKTKTQVVKIKIDTKEALKQVKKLAQAPKNINKCPVPLWKKMAEADRWNYNEFMRKTNIGTTLISPKVAITKKEMDVVRHNLAILYLL